MRRLTCFFLCNLVSLSWAQSTSSPVAQEPAVHVSRKPAQDTPNIDPLQDQISSDLQALQAGAPNIALPNLPSSAPFAHIDPNAVPKDFHPRSDMPLTPTAQAAVRVSEKWLGPRRRG